MQAGQTRRQGRQASSHAHSRTHRHAHTPVAKHHVRPLTVVRHQPCLVHACMGACVQKRRAWCETCVFVHMFRAFMHTLSVLSLELCILSLGIMLNFAHLRAQLVASVVCSHVFTYRLKNCCIRARKSTIVSVNVPCGWCLPASLHARLRASERASLYVCVLTSRSCREFSFASVSLCSACARL